MEPNLESSRPPSFQTGGAPPAHRHPVLPDSSHARWLIPMNGWLERQAFAPLLTAFLVLVVGWIGFQVLGGVVALGLVVVREGASVLSDPAKLLEGQADLLLIGNTVGQFFGLALPVFLVALLHSRSPARFLRLRIPDARQLGLALLGLAVLLPVVQWLSAVNALIPLPESIAAFEKQQLDFLERVLSGDTGTLLNLVALAVTPALCEELFFRGYIQRQFERSLSVGTALILTGAIFGLYHMRFSQIIPLTVLGIYLAYVTWRTGSLWPAVVLHFANNGLALLVSDYVHNHPELGIDSIDTVSVPLYIVLPGAVLFLLAIRAMNMDATERLGYQPVSRPSPLFEEQAVREA